MARTCDYDYIRAFFTDNDELDRFITYFDGIQIAVSLQTHKRFQTQVLLLRGYHPTDIAKQLDMKVGTVWQIRKRMQDNLMYSAEEEAQKYEEMQKV